jgi:hypothetical protein
MIIGPVPSYDSGDRNRNACKIKKIEVRHTDKELSGQINIVVELVHDDVDREGVTEVGGVRCEPLRHNRFTKQNNTKKRDIGNKIYQ